MVDPSWRRNIGEPAVPEAIERHMNPSGRAKETVLYLVICNICAKLTTPLPCWGSKCKSSPVPLEVRALIPIGKHVYAGWGSAGGHGPLMSSVEPTNGVKRRQATCGTTFEF